MQKITLICRSRKIAEDLLANLPDGVSEDIGEVNSELDVYDFVDMYNKAADIIKAQRCRKITKVLRQKIKTRLKDEPSKDYWENVFNIMSKSPELGKNDGDSWSISINFIVRNDENPEKICREWLSFKRRKDFWQAKPSSFKNIPEGIAAQMKKMDI